MFRNEVKQEDIDEAIKLMDYSIKSLKNIKDSKTPKRKSNIYYLI